MDHWPNANHNQDWFVPPKIEVWDNQRVFRDGYHVGDLVPNDSFDQDIFEGIQEALEAHFVSPKNSWNPPGTLVNRPKTIPDTPVDNDTVNPCPSPLPDDEDLCAEEIALDQNITIADSRVERCEYLKRLLSCKLDLDFDISWKTFNQRISENVFLPGPNYKEAVYNCLHRGCSDFYNYYSLEAEYFRVNEDKPIDLSITIDWSETIFHLLGFDW